MSEAESSPIIDTLCLLVGGLDKSQFGIISANGVSPINEVRSACPNVDARRVDDPGYLIGQVPDLTSIITNLRTAYPSIDRVVVVSHSFGWEAGRRAAATGVVDFMIAVDPVGLAFAAEATHHWPSPDGVRQPGIFAKATKQPPEPFIAQLNIPDGPAIDEYPECRHNEIVHHPRFIASIIAACNGTATGETT